MDWNMFLSGFLSDIKTILILFSPFFMFVIFYLILWADDVLCNIGEKND